MKLKVKNFKIKAIPHFKPVTSVPFRRGPSVLGRPFLLEKTPPYIETTDTEHITEHIKIFVSFKVYCNVGLISIILVILYKFIYDISSVKVDLHTCILCRDINYLNPVGLLNIYYTMYILNSPVYIRPSSRSLLVT